ncbi:MAG: hypothetical protein ACP5QN_02025 [Minisyncoccia bacterium]
MFDPTTNNFLNILFIFLKLSWWFWLFLILLPLFKSTYLHWRQEVFQNGKAFEMVMLELKIPREIKQNPKAMEQILIAMHSLRNAPGNFQEKWLNGEVTIWYSLEIVSFGGSIRFFIRCPRARKHLIESAFFSYYPDLELVEVDDYADDLPKNLVDLEERGLNLFGTEMILTKEDAYPIKTYKDFESPDENKEYDPISTFLEVLGKCRKEEIVGIQFLIAPADPKWNEKYNKLVEELKERKNKGNSKSSGENQAQSTVSFIRTPGETDVLKAVEENLSKPAFHTLIRYIYLSPRELFDSNYAGKGISGIFNQYTSLNLNSFRQNGAISTRATIWNKPYIFPKKRVIYKKAAILYDYIKRNMPPETFMGKLITSHFFRWNFDSKTFLLTTTCLATLFHPPTSAVLIAPHIERIQSKKAGPPPNISIFGEEKEIEKFYE